MALNYLFLGDTHGDLDFVQEAANVAAETHAEIIQVGDWGFVWPGANQLETLDLVLRRAGVRMRFLDGNHDHQPYLRAACAGNYDVGVELTPNVIYQPRGSVHEDADGTRFLFLGGAPSIDRWSRTPGRTWWPEEEIHQAELDRALAARGPIHVVCTHDAPAYPAGFGPIGDASFDAISRASLNAVAQVLAKHRPMLHVHGHWHRRYALHRLESPCVTVGLDCNYETLARSSMAWSRP